MTRRDNGLHATAYVRLVDVETYVVDGLLERLREEEIAAYVAPAGGRRGPYGDTVLPESPSDSVYVDSEREELARGVIDRYLGNIREELAWASIVAAYDEPSAGGAVPRWPASEDLDTAGPSDGSRDDAGDGSRDGDAGPGHVVRPALPPVGFDELRGPADRVSPDGDDSHDATGPTDVPEDHFRPPPPPPVPVPDVVGRFAWAGVLGGPLFLVLGTIFGLDISGWPGFLAFAAFVGGFVTLVARMKDRPPTDSGYDDGAVV